MGKMLHPEKFVGPRLPIPNAMSTDWWGRNKVPRNLVERMRVDKATREVEKLLERQAQGAVLDDVKQVALRVYKAAGTPLAKKLHAALLAGDVDSIAMCSVDPRNYATASEYYLDACASAFLRKFEQLGELCGREPTDLVSPAVAEFFRAEAQCKESNARIIAYQEGLLSPVIPNVRRIIKRARMIIQDALGAAPSSDKLELRFGPGATSACSGDAVTIADKLAAFPELTWDSRHFISVVQSSPCWSNLIRAAHPEKVYNDRFVTDDFGNQVWVGKFAPILRRGDRFTTVPKTALIDRGITIQPHTLSALQLAVGKYLEDALARLGIRKDLQQVVNRGFALAGSLFEGSFATVDLKAASDTVCYELVKLLLPWDWFELLASLRCGETWIDGEWVELEKFSAMGNGYTFELETLIFYAIARSVSDLYCTSGAGWPVCAYGDDLIVASECYSELTSVLDWFGFTTNGAKSFCKGSFRESCGGDYFAGHDVRPYFLKETPCDSSEWYRVANGLSRNNERCSALGLGPTRFGPAWLRAVGNIPKSLRLFGPKGYGDDWIHHEEEVRWRVEHKHGMKYVLGTRAIPRHRSLTRYCNDTQYAAILYGGAADRLTLRGEPQRVTVEWYHVV